MLYHYLNEFILTGTINQSWLDVAKKAALADSCQAKFFDITPINVDAFIEQRLELLSLVFLKISQFCQTNLKISSLEILQLLWHLWLPMAIKLASIRQNLNRPLIQGILGGQGTGKTTICKILSLILEDLGCYTLSLSLDDLYKTYSDRLILTQQDPRLIWRGPPGTHDIDLGLNLFDQIRQDHSPLIVPRFDKSAEGGAGDRSIPEMITKVDIVLFEGWFVGVQPIAAEKFINPPPPIITSQHRQFAYDMNQQLRNYSPLWEYLDSLIVLYPTDYRYSLEWRKQAEREMIARGKSGMTDQEVEEFVKYFWRALHPELFIKTLLQSSAIDLALEINADHQIVLCK